MVQEFENKINKLFNCRIEYESFEPVYRDYIDMLINIKDINNKQLIDFINEHKESLMKSYKSNNILIDLLLKDNKSIRRDKINTLNYSYYSNLFDSINKGIVDSKTLPILIDAANIIYIYGLNNPNIDEYLESGIYSETNRNSIGSKTIDVDNKKTLSDTYYRWYKRFGFTLIPYLNELDILLIRIKELSEYLDVTGLMSTCHSAIEYRKNNEIPTEEEIKKINSIVDNYKVINNELLIDLINSGEYSFVHFVQTEKINYQLIEDKIIDVNAKDDLEESEFNKEQNTVMIISFTTFVRKYLEEITGKTFDITNKMHHRMMSEMINKYNYTRNNLPTKRLPINIYEISNGFKKYIRPMSNRISTSLISNEEIHPHLNRSIALVLKPLTTDSILSTSIGYTSFKDNVNLENDLVSIKEMLTYGVTGKTNEVTLDVTKCEVTSILVLSQEQKVIERANELASSYGVPVINKIINKTL